MKTLPIIAVLAAFASVANAQTRTFVGDGATGFGGPLGDNTLTLSESGGMLNGSFDNQLGDDLVIYFDTGAGGATSLPTAADTDTATNTDVGRLSIVNTGGSGIDSFGTGFGANYALALSSGTPTTDFLYSIPATGASADTISYVQTASDFSGTGVAPVTFSLSLASLGLTTGESFSFIATYLNANGQPSYRSNETLAGVTITDDGVPTNTSNPGTDNVSFSGADVFTGTTAATPEPGTVGMLFLGAGILFWAQRRFVKGNLS